MFPKLGAIWPWDDTEITNKNNSWQLSVSTGLNRKSGRIGRLLPLSNRPPSLVFSQIRKPRMNRSRKSCNRFRSLPIIVLSMMNGQWRAHGRPRISVPPAPWSIAQFFSAVLLEMCHDVSLPQSWRWKGYVYRRWSSWKVSNCNANCITIALTAMKLDHFLSFESHCNSTVCNHGISQFAWYLWCQYHALSGANGLSVILPTQQWHKSLFSCPVKLSNHVITKRSSIDASRTSENRIAAFPQGMASPNPDFVPWPLQIYLSYFWWCSTCILCFIFCKSSEALLSIPEVFMFWPWVVGGMYEFVLFFVCTPQYYEN